MTAKSCDLVVRGGTVLDGTGRPPQELDVGVTDSRISALAARGQLSGSTVVDASGMVVAPGFVDLHSHADFSIAGHPAANTALAQGVTTLVTGNCGFSPFPCPDPALLARATAFMNPELDWDWRDAAGYADAMDAVRPGVNLALQVGHCALRLAVLGTDERAPGRDELVSMCRMVADAAEHGVIGFSTGLIYAPGCYADPDEIAAVVAVAQEHDMLYSTHMRNEADRLLGAVREALETAKHAGTRLEISHLKAMGRANHGTVLEALELIERARADGLDVGCDVYPYTASSTTLTSRLPAWAMGGGIDALLARLGDPQRRAEVSQGLRARMEHDIDPDRVVIADLAPGPYEDAVGQTLADLGHSFGIDPADAALSLLNEHQGTVATVNHAMSPEDVAAVLQHPLSSVASDGWTMRPSGQGKPHPRSFGTFARVLGRYVREDGLLTLADAVRKMTSVPASRAGLRDRGVLRVGAVADIAAFDPDTVLDRSTFEAPWQLAAGMDHVLVAGQPAVRDGKLTGERHGQVLRRK